MSRSEDRRLEAQLAGADIKLVLDERRRLQAQVGLLRDQLHLAEETLARQRKREEALQAAVEALRLELYGFPVPGPEPTEPVQAVLSSEIRAERLTRQEAVKLVARQERELSRLRACVRDLRTALRYATEPGGRELEAIGMNRDQLLIGQVQLAQAAQPEPEPSRERPPAQADKGLSVARERAAFPPWPEPTEPPECPVCGETMTGHVCPGCGWEEAGRGQA